MQKLCFVALGTAKYVSSQSKKLHVWVPSGYSADVMEMSNFTHAKVIENSSIYM